MFQEAKNMFIKALDAYVQKCQELTSQIGNETTTKNNSDNSENLDSKNTEINDEIVEENELEQMVKNFTSMLQGFAFQFESASFADHSV